MHLRINEHLEKCSACARWFEQQSALEDVITHSLQADREPNASVWDHIESQLVAPQPTRPRNWLLLGSLTLAVAASVLIAVALGLWSSPPPDLASLSIRVHDELANGREHPKFASTSHLEIEDYLRQHVGFPVRCPPREDAGFEARGGGTCTLAGDSAAYVVGRVDGADVSLFILSRDSLTHFPDQQRMLRRERTHHRRDGNLDVLMTEFDRNLVLVVGKAPPEKLHRLLQAYGSYADSRHVHHES